MSVRSFNASKALTVLALAALGSFIVPCAAHGQSRGSLQVTATVVASNASLSGLEAAQRAAVAWATNGSSVSNDVSTLAQIDVAGTIGTSDRAVVVNVDFLKN